MTHGHVCHHPRCNVHVAARLFACRRHWFSLPMPIRGAISAAYRPGQERTKRVSMDWLNAAKAALAFWRDEVAA